MDKIFSRFPLLDKLGFVFVLLPFTEPMDPDDLAAAFFAQQAAKEQKKVTLPTSDWVHVIEARRAADVSVGDGDAKVEVDDGAANSNSNSDKDSTAMRSMDPESWLVTTMPAAPPSPSTAAATSVLEQHPAVASCMSPKGLTDKVLVYASLMGRVTPGCISMPTSPHWMQ